jgi:hypothetical protein
MIRVIEINQRKAQALGRAKSLALLYVAAGITHKAQFCQLNPRTAEIALVRSEIRSRAENSQPSSPSDYYR